MHVKGARMFALSDAIVNAGRRGIIHPVAVPLALDG